jgi:Tfp pilus assembly protein PilF
VEDNLVAQDLAVELTLVDLQTQQLERAKGQVDQAMEMDQAKVQDKV